MRLRASLVENKKSVESFLLVCVIVAASLAIMLPLTAPKVSAQVTHLASAMAEDAFGLPYDTTPPGDGLVYWDGAETHIMNQNYIVDPGFELRIPALHAMGLPPTTIEMQAPVNITVMGKLTFENDGPFTTTRIWQSGGFGWTGIYFMPGSEGMIQDVEINDAITPITFSPDSTILFPGIESTRVQAFSGYGIYIDGAVGYTNLHSGVEVLDTFHAGTGIYTSNCMLNLTDVVFAGHGPFYSNLHISNAYVTSTNNYFNEENVAGNAIVVENSPAPNSTVVTGGIFDHGEPDRYYVKGDGGSPKIINGTFNEANNALAVRAQQNSMTFQNSHITLINPSAMTPSPFNSTRLNATGGSTVTVNWYVDVFVNDTDGNPIPNSLVDLEDPSWPDTMSTDAGGDLGWARGFVVTEKVVHYSTIDNFNPLNASAENNTMIGYADPEPDINTSMDVFITVGLNPTPNTPPTVTIDTPLSGVYTGFIDIEYTVTDIDPGDDGFLEALVEYYDPATGWVMAEPSGPITGLWSGDKNLFVWDSRHPNNLPDVYTSNVQIQIIPSDKLGTGTPDLSNFFDVDNIGPVVLTGPTNTTTDTSCVIEWTLDEPATSEVWYGLYGDGSVNDLTTEVVTLTLNTTPVLSLSGLLPGRRYTYAINSTDNMGNKYSSADPVKNFFFETTLSIQLYTGWNMISIPHLLLDWSLHLVLGSIAGDWDIAMSYDANDPNNDPWKTNYTGKPYHMNDLHEYYSHMALWLHVTTDTVLTPNYMYDKDLAPITIDIQLVEGWNFVGYYSMIQRNIDDALLSIAGSYDKVEHYDTSSDLWLTYPGLLSTMEPTKGYWIHATQAVLWVMPYE